MTKQEVSRPNSDIGYTSRISSIVSLPMKRIEDRKIVKRIRYQSYPRAPIGTRIGYDNPAAGSYGD